MNSFYGQIDQLMVYLLLSETFQNDEAIISIESRFSQILYNGIRSSVLLENFEFLLCRQ